METCYELESFKVRLSVAEAPRRKVVGSDQAVPILRAIYADLDADQEHFAVLMLDEKSQIRGFKVLFTGSQSESLTHPAVVYRTAILFGASAIVVAHNHPSGDSRPSPADNVITWRLKQSAALLGLRFYDHIILGNGSYFSFRDRGLLDGIRPIERERRETLQVQASGKGRKAKPMTVEERVEAVQDHLQEIKDQQLSLIATMIEEL